MEKDRFVLQVDGKTKSEYRRFVDAVRTGLQLKQEFHRLKLLSLLGGLLISCFAGTYAANAQAPEVVCDQYARSYAAYYGPNGSVVRGAAGGALVGAAIGSFSGRMGRGAAIGAGLGAIFGGARRAAAASNLYNAAYQDCMARNAR